MTFYFQRIVKFYYVNMRIQVFYDKFYEFSRNSSKILTYLY